MAATEPGSGATPSRAAEILEQYAESIRDGCSGGDGEESFTCEDCPAGRDVCKADHAEIVGAAAAVRALVARSETGDLEIAKAAIKAMAEDGWLYHGVEGMSESQEICYQAYLKLGLKDAVLPERFAPRTETEPRIAASMSEYRRVTAMGGEIKPPKGRDDER